MKTIGILVLGIGIGLGLAGGIALPLVDAKISETRLDKRLQKLEKKARKRGTVEGGICPAIVTGNRDPEGRFRVRVRFPWQEKDEPGVWAGRATPPGSDPSTFLPELDDEVVVAFFHGDIRAPVVLGELWDGKDPPEDR
jgi:uncharacterized protein involved in type VI secretion and phage assembly